MFATQVYKWNSVNISNRENQLHVRGIVVDKTETGLLVDLGITNKKPELVAFDRIIQDDEPAYPQVIDWSDADPVNLEVLLQLSAKQPWTWYPAEVLSGSRNSFRCFMLVKANISDEDSVIDIVRKTQVRCCANQDSLTSVLFNDYLKEHVDVPYDFVVTPAFRELWTRKDRFRRTYPIRVVDRKLYYLRWFCDMDLDPLAVAAVIEESIRQNIANVINRGIKRPHKDCEDENTLQPVFSDLPYDILHLVLSHLDIVQLIHYRRVCPLWNLVITSTDSTTVVTYDIRTYDNKDSYVLAAVLFKFIKKATIYLIFTGRTGKTTAMPSCTFAQLMDVIKTILDHTGITIPAIVVADFEMKKSDLFEQGCSSTAVPSSTTLHSSICQRVILVRVTLFNLLKNESTRSALSPYREWDLKVFCASIRPDNINQWTLRDALEPSARQFVKSVSEHNIGLLHDWIRKVSQVGNGNSYLFHKNLMMQVLTIWEGDDQRFGPAWTWDDIEAIQLHNKLDSLHSVTILCLLYAMEKYPEIGEIEDIQVEDVQIEEIEAGDEELWELLHGPG